jgi:dienelactone hydrolase
MNIPFAPETPVVALDPIMREECVAFFRSDPGKGLLEAWAALRPAVDKSRPEISLGEISGYEHAFVMLQFLLRPPPVEEKKEQTAYPPLDDDAAWKDVDRRLEQSQ